MKKTFMAAAIIGTAALAFAKDSDPVLMTVAGRDVKLSEFEYLYNKNNAQQSQELSFDEYLGMFVNYKLKVADAHAHGIDTTAAFVNEFHKYSLELAQPYLRDIDMLEKMARTEYARMPVERYVSHIMLRIDPNNEAASRATADSVRSLVAEGKMAFEDAARAYSIDGGSASQGGRMGWITSYTRLPQAFTDMAYSTPVGEISDVVNSGYGLHIIRTEQERPLSGEVNAKHILMLTHDMDEAGIARQKARIDSIYKVVTAPGADFADVARRCSEDPGSARNGGDLGWFGPGRMVQEFEDVAFALKDGEISKPFASAFGWHIIYRVAHRADTIPPYDDVRPAIIKRFEQDGRIRKAEKAYIDAMASRTGSKINPDIEAQVAKHFSSNGFSQIDSTAYASLLASDIEAYTVQGRRLTLSDALKGSGMRLNANADVTAHNIAIAASNAFDKAILDLAREELLNTNTDYRNLINEYRDGIMLFDRSNQMVWEKATADKDGQETFFRNNKANYAWDAPRYKAYVIFAKSDSVMQLAKAHADTFNASAATQDEFTQSMKQKFGNNVKVEKVIAAKGENPYTDNLGFGMPRPAQNSRWPYYFAYQGRVIEAPEAAEDVRGRLITDYQNYLESIWVEYLHKTYKVKFNKKAVAQARKRIDSK